jgi:hypothetical protein
MCREPATVCSDAEQLKSPKFGRKHNYLYRKFGKANAKMKEMEDWRCQLVEWAESLMTMLWGRPEQETAARITALQGWIEDSPV